MFETREQVLEKIMEQKKPLCPHCGKEMKLWEVPPFTVGDGLGWGTPFLYLCFNDNCKLYRQGWDHMKTTYAHTASYRCMNYPGTEQFELIPVFSEQGGRGQIVDEQLMAEQEAIKEAIKNGFSMLAECFVRKDGPSVLTILMDSSHPNRVRRKAAEMIGDIGEVEAVEPLRSARFGNDLVQKEVDAAITKIHQRHFTRECPFCAEIIKKRAKICKHCGKEVAGL
jgi:ribosomal protein L37AE/L43A